MAAASRKEEERNERIVRGLLKLPPNRRCINCNGLGPQYVCTSFWTFICISCSGIHREFTHRVKSVSMSTFTTQEIEALQKGGNKRARESFLKDFDAQQMRLPDSSNIDSLREFIKAVYVERRYAGGRFSERPPRDKQNQNAHEEEHRRARSYHSFSQSPPYDYQYEERHNGKQSTMLTRKPGSDRGHDGKMSGFAYSPHSLHERMSEDRFANESCGSRTSDCSGSSTSDMLKTAPQSPNFLGNGCFSPPVQPDQTNIQTSNGITQSQKTVSTGNIDSTSLKSGKSSLADMLFEPDNFHGTQQTKISTASSFIALSDVVSAAKEDLFYKPVAQQQPVTGLDPPVDLFANMPPLTPSADRVPPAAPSVDSAGWATFDTPPEEKQLGVTGLSGVAAIGKDKQALSRDLFSFEPNDQPTWFETSKDNALVINQSVVPPCKDTTPNASNSQPWSTFDATSGKTQQAAPGDLSLMSPNPQEPKGPMDGNSSQFWHSFDDVSGIMDDPSSARPQTSEHKNVDNLSLTAGNPFTCSIASKESHNDDSQKFFMDGLVPNAPFAAFLEPFPLSVVPPVEGASADQTTLNPFDLPFDTDVEAQDMFTNVSALRAALPNPDLPTSFLDGLPETWFNSTSAFVPSGSHGGLPCLVEQVPNSPLRNITLSTGSTGNPFA